jgi:hypothetical protein
MSTRVAEQVVLGVSTRGYARSLEPVDEEVIETRGDSKSNVSRSLIDRTTEKLAEFLNRRLEELDVIAMFIDGIEIGKHRGGGQHTQHSSRPEESRGSHCGAPRAPRKGGCMRRARRLHPAVELGGFYGLAGGRGLAAHVDMTFRDMMQDAEMRRLEAQQQVADGATTDVLASLVKQVKQLQQEAARQNVMITVLTQALIESGGVNGGVLKQRYDQAMTQAQAQANLVVCGRCRKQVDRRYTQMSANGPLCDGCYQELHSDE